MSPSKRLEAVEATIRKHGWSMRIRAELCRKTGWSPRTIERDKDRVMVILRDEEVGTRENRRTMFLREVRAAREAALNDGKYSAVATMDNLRSRVLGLDVPPPEPEEETDAASGLTGLQSLLHETRKLRKEAQSRGSMVAAAQLLEREQAILADIRAEEEAKAAALAKTASDADVLAAIEGAIRELPDSLLDRLASAIEARRTPPPADTGGDDG